MQVGHSGPASTSKVIGAATAAAAPACVYACMSLPGCVTSTAATSSGNFWHQVKNSCCCCVCVLMQVAISTKDVYKTAEQIRAAGGKITREPGMKEKGDDGVQGFLSAWWGLGILFRVHGCLPREL